MKKILLLLTLVLYACEVDNLYSSYYCNFMFQANLYPTSALTNAITSSGGNFCIVKAVLEKGVWHLKLTPNQGSFADSDLDLTMNTAIGNERINYNTMGRKRGLIIGRTYSGVRCALCLRPAMSQLRFHLRTEMGRFPPRTPMRQMQTRL